jgi:tetratricopeptide (TPR) repeat protein
MALACAPVYYMYGAALFCKAQEDKAVAPPPESEEEDDEEEGSDGSGSGSEGEGAGAGEAESDMQLAWENLEYARLIYSGGPGGAPGAPAAPEHAEPLAQCHVKLGQVSMEEEQFEAALADFDTALRLFRGLSPPPPRPIAGLLYDAALVLQQLERPAEALARLGDAAAALEARLQALRMAAPAGAPPAPEAADLAATLAEVLSREEELFFLSD